MLSGLDQRTVISVAPECSFSFMFLVVILREASLQELHCFTYYFSASSPYKKMHVIACYDKIKKRDLVTSIGLKHKFVVFITVTRKLQKEFAFVATVGDMITGMIQKSPSSPWHEIPPWYVLLLSNKTK